MSVNTVNAYGRITVTEEAIAEVAGSSALECYGVVDLVPKNLSDSFRTCSKRKRIRVAFACLRTETEYLSTCTSS